MNYTYALLHFTPSDPEVHSQMTFLWDAETGAAHLILPGWARTSQVLNDGGYPFFPTFEAMRRDLGRRYADSHVMVTP